jgi:hypothetical protein
MKSIGTVRPDDPWRFIGQYMYYKWKVQVILRVITLSLAGSSSIHRWVHLVKKLHRVFQRLGDSLYNFRVRGWKQPQKQSSFLMLFHGEIGIIIEEILGRGLDLMVSPAP